MVEADGIILGRRRTFRHDLRAEASSTGGAGGVATADVLAQGRAAWRRTGRRRGQVVDAIKTHVLMLA
jgi:hypothetical protein